MTEIEVVANALGSVTGKPAHVWREYLKATAADPTFTVGDLLVTLPSKATEALLGELRHEAPHALNWLLAGCRPYVPSQQRRW